MFTLLARAPNVHSPTNFRSARVLSGGPAEAGRLHDYLREHDVAPKLFVFLGDAQGIVGGDVVV